MKPSIPQGTRDFGPEIVRKRDFILKSIRSVFELYGFQPLETPAMENLETLTGKYGEEGDKLIFRILNNGLENPAKHQAAREAFERILAGKNDNAIAERALRYDLTIPFARYVAMNHSQLTFPFKRYQVQPVWRADRPQKSRYREFLQFDADVVGTRSMLSDVEFANIYFHAFERLGLTVVIKINNRKILYGLAELCGCQQNLTTITVAIDKLEKIGIDHVNQELFAKGLEKRQVNWINRYLSISGTNDEKLKSAFELLSPSAVGRIGLQELEFLSNRLSSNLSSFVIDFTLARGLNYYTGTIYEVEAQGVSIGSVGGGGRYDDLTGLFDLQGMPGVGISFGIDRIYDAMEELGRFPSDIYVSTKILFFNLGSVEAEKSLELMHLLRSKNIPCELFHEASKFDRQFKYAEKKNIPFAVIIGSKELERDICTIKNLKTGQQQTIPSSGLANFEFV
ncbi:MAG TPA: histidine--tRNA ligase [Puia sp.]|nr:histidine--tRNA ligase [Puia sp.]